MNPPSGEGGPRGLRLFVAEPLPAAGADFDLPAGPARHVMVRRLQPGATLHLFDGTSGVEWPAEVRAITRRGVRVRLGAAARPAAAAELPIAVTLAFGMPGNERADTLVEKATELGAAVLQPLASERTVLRLAGERAERRRAHWQAIAAAACEQCGRARVPVVHDVRELGPWLSEVSAVRDAAGAKAQPPGFLLSTAPQAPPWRSMWPVCARATQAVLLSGPEGGFSAAEEQQARAAGFAAISLGPRILRADTAPLAALAGLALSL
ncbi:MAG: 16S rRNA (uracil(1498)-N(3))-methyltransferase [Rubrivivax sp.]|nr:16S rRNA (uracil(1498)-N(3))-methyltransferase [Rubrivivax sp.]